MNTDYDEQISFRNYLNYIKILGEFLKKNSEENIKQLTQTSDFKNIPKKKVDVKILSKFLRNAWLTEIQLRQNSSDEEFVIISNHWICVKIYYSIYLVLRALCLCMDSPIKESHTSVLKEISNQIKQRRHIFPEPWSILCIGLSGENKDYMGIPNAVLLNHKESNLKKNQDFYQSFSRFLKTTRKRLIDKDCSKFKKDKKVKKIKKIEKEKIQNMLYPTSLFDCLYRLRIRSNYEDADMFFSSDIENLEAMEFATHIQNICNYTLLFLETLIAKYISQKAYKVIIDDFKEKHTRLFPDGNFPGPVERWENNISTYL